ncbi:MAG: ParB N-terminal domain-containing protein [Treponema sp.]
MAIENVDINSIKVKKRIREKTVSIQPLVESIQKYGLLEPIIIDQNNRLIAGFRRLQACKQLGFKTILVNVVSVEDAETFLLLELEENTCRFQFSEEELTKAKKQLEKIRHPNFFVWLWNKIISFFTRKKKVLLE